jgi:hypothetical protein
VNWRDVRFVVIKLELLLASVEGYTEMKLLIIVFLGAGCIFVRSNSGGLG